MADGTAYRDVILRIKVEADQGVERTLQGIGASTDNAVRNIEKAFGAALSNVEAAIKRLEVASSRLAGGGRVMGGDGASLTGGGGAPIGGGGFGVPIGAVGSGAASAVNSAAGFTGMAGMAFNHPVMQAGAAAAASLGPSQAAAFGQYQNALASAIAAQQASAAAAAAWAPQNSLAQINARGGGTPYNRMSALGGYATGPGPTVAPPRPATRGGGLGFDRDRLVGIGIGLASGNWDSVGGSVGTIGGTLIGSAIGGPIGGGIGGAIGGLVGSSAVGAGEYAYAHRDIFNGYSNRYGLSGPLGDLAGTATGVQGLIGDAIGTAYANRFGDFGKAGVSRAQAGLEMQQRATAIAAIDTAAAEDRAGREANLLIGRNAVMADATLEGQLGANRKSQGELGAGAPDEKRLALKQQELQLTRQIAQEQTRGAQAALRSLEREKQHLEDALALRQKQVNATGESLGFSGTRNMQLTLGAAEKLASGQGGSLTDEEVQALQGIRGIGGTLPGLLEEEGNKRAAPVLGRIKDLFGVNKELADKQAAIDKVQGEITAKTEMIVKIEMDQKSFEAPLRAAISDLMGQMNDQLQALADKAVRESKERIAHESATNSAARSRMGRK